MGQQARERHYEEASALFARALRAHHEFAYAHWGIGHCQAMLALSRAYSFDACQPRLVEAEDHLRAAIRIAPDWALPHYDLAVVQTLHPGGFVENEQRVHGELQLGDKLAPQELLWVGLYYRQLVKIANTEIRGPAWLKAGTNPNIFELMMNFMEKIDKDDEVIAGLRLAYENPELVRRR